MDVRIGVIVLEHHYRGFTEEAVRSALSQSLRPGCVLLSTGDDRPYDIPGVRVQRLKTDSEGERLAAAVKDCPGVDAYALLEDDDVWAPGHLERAARWLARGRVFYQSGTTPPMLPLGGNVSSMAFTADLDLGKASSYPTLLGRALLLSAVEQRLTVVYDPEPTVTRRVHGQGLSVGRKGWWLEERDRLLRRLLEDFQDGQAHELAYLYLLRDYGRGLRLRRAAGLLRWGL